MKKPKIFIACDTRSPKKIKKIISGIIGDKEIVNAARNYRASKKESLLLPKAISLRFQFLIEIACKIRAKRTIKNRRKGE